jgi:hypothetical protein
LILSKKPDLTADHQWMLGQLIYFHKSGLLNLIVSVVDFVLSSPNIYKCKDFNMPSFLELKNLFGFIIAFCSLAMISACGGSVTETVTAKHISATLSSITITPDNPSISVNSTRQFTATGTFSNGTQQDITASVIWSASNTLIATVDSTGLATGVAAGTAMITATSSMVSSSTTGAATTGTASITAPSGTISGSTTLKIATIGPVTLSWNAPTNYTDGTALTIGLYKIYYGISTHNYTKQVDVFDPSVTQYTLNLEPGTYFFTVTAFDPLGFESDYSNEVSITL